MIPTATLLTEFIVVGSISWLWILPLIMTFYHLSAKAVIDYLGTAPTPHLIILIFATYVIGVFTESLSFAVEKLAVGATSNPRKWYTNRIARMTSHDWHAAQERMWTSETAFKEFRQTHLRSNISRGAFCNAFLAMVILICLSLAKQWKPEYYPILIVSCFISVVSPFSWWFAQTEHTARVRVAGEIEKNKKSGEQKNPADAV